MKVPDRIRADFVEMVRGPDEALELARVALLVAAESDVDVDIDGELRQLEGWAEELKSRVAPDHNNLQKLARLRSFVFEELGFRGDRKDYYSPSNSLLHEVMKRRRGIPLTLAIVFMELGWRIGIPFEGVAFPGHFLVRLPGEPRDLLIDPYKRGMMVHEEDCRQMLLETTGGRMSFDPSLTASVGKRDMIARLLHNLKGAYLRAGDDEMALAAVERLLVLAPGDPEETRDRGLLLFRMQRYGRALDALNAYLAAAPDAPDHETIEGHARALRQLLASLN
ncbi:MAG TPA: tetratricopeptide repeat protein [Candidatus Eisenbacteria bacterium]|jgi:regulator of sirC expression with transglutaminase-like and TPR domain